MYLQENHSIEEIRLKLLLPAMPAYKELLQAFKLKTADIWEYFYTTDAMLNMDWMSDGYDLHHTITRLAVQYMDFTKSCVWQKLSISPMQNVYVRCEYLCKRYHVFKCVCRRESLTEFCTEVTNYMSLDRQWARFMKSIFFLRLLYDNHMYIVYYSTFIQLHFLRW